MESSLGRRSNTGYLAAREAQVLTWLCARMPAFVVPDHLTVVALAGAFITFCGFAASGYNPGFLWVAGLGLVTNWFGDSLDGSLARYRGQARARYGYFLDCMSDAFCCLMIMIGLGLSPYVHMEAALFSLAGYFMLCIFVFLNHHVNGVHKLSFLGCGPTETRLSLIALTGLMLIYGPSHLLVFGHALSIYDLALIANGLLSIGVFLSLMMKGIEQLSVQDPAPVANQIVLAEARGCD
ncbi:MAG: CDP-alcohol phosphatidyltransferase family protein [Methylovirgula sp.]|uniref:CDP-alcohol phosphatidyltransferase family protein n=1 Tax=Methylovirgula sp. TaxID=1978224 RepID=UPI0030761F2F